MKALLLIISFYVSTLSAPLMAQSKDMLVHPDEQLAYDSYLQFKDIKARKLVEASLKRNKKSSIAYTVLGLVTREDEGNTTRALHYFKKAIKYAEEVCGPKPTSKNCVKWHSIAYQEKIRALKDLDRSQEAYDDILHYDQLYNPKLDLLKIWPLIKLRKLDEAERIAENILKGSQNYDRISGLNNLCVIASERNLRLRSNEVCSQAAEKTDSMVIHYNTGISKFAIFDLQAAERVVRRGANLQNDMYGSAWEFLVYQYTLEARFSEAISAAKNASETHREFNGLKEELSRSHFLIGISHLLLSLGRFEDAAEMIRESIDTPDRTGKISGDPDFDQLSGLSSFDRTLAGLEQHYKETLALSPWKEKVKIWGLWLECKMERFLVQHRIKKLLEKKNLFVKIVTPYPPSLGPLETLPHWLVAGLMESIGPGPFEAAVKESRRLETELLDKSAPYYLTLMAQVKFKRGQYQETIQSTEQAIQSLPPQERLIKDLLRTLQAVSYTKVGKKKEARKVYFEILRGTPTFIRLWDFQLPVKFILEKGPHSDQALDLLEKSPRLDEDELGIPLRIRSTKDRISLCLIDSYQSDIHCKNAEIRQNDEDKQFHLENIVINFIQEALSPKIDLSQLDVNSLNGAPIKGSGQTAIKDLLEQKSPFPQFKLEEEKAKEE